MMEKRSAPITNYHKKITPYLDGTLSPEEKSEFEAYVRTHPEFEAQIKAKEDEIQLIRNLIPAVVPSKETLQSLESEMKQSVFNLLKEEPKNFWDDLKTKLDDWLN